MKFYLMLMIIGMSANTADLKAQTCTGENGVCQTRREGEFLSLGSSHYNYIELMPGLSNSYAANFYRSLQVNSQSGRVGHEVTIVKEIPNLLRCEMTIRSGAVACKFKGT